MPSVFWPSHRTPARRVLAAVPCSPSTCLVENRAPVSFSSAQDSPSSTRKSRALRQPKPHSAITHKYTGPCYKASKNSSVTSPILSHRHKASILFYEPLKINNRWPSRFQSHDIAVHGPFSTNNVGVGSLGLYTNLTAARLRPKGENTGCRPKPFTGSISVATIECVNLIRPSSSNSKKIMLRVGLFCRLLHCCYCCQAVVLFLGPLSSLAPNSNQQARHFGNCPSRLCKGWTSFI